MTVTECRRHHREPAESAEPPGPPPTDADVLLGRVLAGELSPSADLIITTVIVTDHCYSAVHHLDLVPIVFHT